MVHCETRFRRLTLPPTIDGMQPLTLYGIHIVGTGSQQGEPPVQRHLLTTLPAKNADAASAMVGYYLQQWRVAEFFRVLKSGRMVEMLAFRITRVLGTGSDRPSCHISTRSGARCRTPRRRSPSPAQSGNRACSSPDLSPALPKADRSHVLRLDCLYTYP